ncbi:MAG: hypothetical protein KKH98_15400 [Spirochaetes bacterium]|nr:hypothetical protein [Spirochaetota bacterium]
MKKKLSIEEKTEKVVTEIISRAIKAGKRKKRTITIAKTIGGQQIPVDTLNPKTEEGKQNLKDFFRKVRLYYIFFNLGKPADKNFISWRIINLPLHRRVKNVVLTMICSMMKGCNLKNRIYRMMGVEIGKNVEIMHLAWLDHFRPELISIGDNTLLGAFTKLSVHFYEGEGTFRVGYIKIGNNCKIGAGTGMAFIRMEDDVRALPGTALSPYFTYLKKGTVVGFNPPPKKCP